MPTILTKQISHFFGQDKDLEPGKWVHVKRWGEPEEAFDLIHAAVARLKENTSAV